jgi:DNA-binding Lrp family transcriptional regulator
MGLIEKTQACPLVLSAGDQDLIRAVANGLPITRHPYAAVAQSLDWSETQVIQRLHQLIDAGVIKRFGVVVQHRELGYRANGMVVWDIADQRVAELGSRIAAFPCVTLSYRRPRHLPDWPYNLFTMVHGHHRQRVIEKVAEIVEQCALHDIPHEILFSTRRFKQRGASYQQPGEHALKLVKPGVSHDL